MSQQLLRFRDLRERGVVNNWTTLQRWIKQCGFPRGVKIGPNSRAWYEKDVDEWLAAREAEQS
jgi:predicted DNA-binding transcriptional regulator AlpA